MGILETRGPISGQCNICGDFGPLTVDHTPPKGFAPAVAVQVAHIAQRVGSEKGQRGSKRPDGVKYRSLCERCNRDLLGVEYDPALISMSQQTVRLFETEILLPSSLPLRIKPQRVARSVLGHMAAQGAGRYLKGEITEPLRDYILDPSLPMLPNLRLAYWLYPYKTRVLTRDSSIMNLQGREPALFWLMKAFPLAFMAIWNREFRFDRSWQIRDFDAYTTLGIDDEADAMIDLFNPPSEYLPEAPTDSTILLMGEQAISAIESTPRGRLIKK